jgi:Domain of unknown function (DUF5666)
MTAISYDDPDQPWKPDPAGESATAPPPGRGRRQLFNRRTAALAALITCAGGFYAGINVEKGQLAGASTTSAPGAGARSGATAGGPSAARGGFAARFGGGAGNASIGTVSSVNGKTVYITDTSGNTVKVTLSSATKVTKSEPVRRSSVHPGDAVVIQGVKNSNGTISASSVTDSGASAAATGFAGPGAAAGASGASGSSAPSSSAGS